MGKRLGLLPHDYSIEPDEPTSHTPDPTPEHTHVHHVISDHETLPEISQQTMDAINMWESPSAVETVKTI